MRFSPLEEKMFEVNIGAFLLRLFFTFKSYQKPDYIEIKFGTGNVAFKEGPDPTGSRECYLFQSGRSHVIAASATIMIDVCVWSHAATSQLLCWDTVRVRECVCCVHV